MLTLTQKSPTISHTTTCDAPASSVECCTPSNHGSLRLSHTVASTTGTPARMNRAGGAVHSTEFKPARLSPVGAHLWTLSADEAALDIALDRMIDAVLGKA